MLIELLSRSRLGIRHLVVAVFVAAALLIVAPTGARAATYTVGANADTTPTACPSATATNCSLRQLVMYVEAHPSPPDTINVPAGDYILDSAYGQIAITANLTIAGSGANLTTVEAPVPSNRSTSGDRVFDIEAPSGGSAPTVTLSGLEISGGDANSANGYFGGDILSSGTLALDDDWITNGFACSGGGVSNTGGTLSIERSLISANASACSGGGDDSGGVQNYGEPAASGTADLPAHLTIDDSTIVANAARLGAGIYSWNDANNTVAISNSTVADNTEQAEGGNAARGGGGGVGISTGSAQLQNTILAGNTTTAGGGAGPVPSNCASPSPLTTLGHNLEDANTCGFTGPGDLPNTNPQLGALANNGGPTATLALPAGSPALAQVPAASCSATDQRGVARPTTANCDIGAFELTPAGASTSTSPATTTSTPAPTSSSPSAPPSSPTTSFTVGSATPGGVALDATSSDPTGVTIYKWTYHGGQIVCPASESQLQLESSGPISEAVTLSALSASDSVVSTATKTVSIASRLNVRRRAATSLASIDGVCQGPSSLPVPPLTPKKPAAPPRGPVGGAPPAGCTDDLDFGAVDVHGCLAEVFDPKNLPGGITAELGEAICSSTGEILCLPSLVVGDGFPGPTGYRSTPAVTASALKGVTQDLESVGLPSYYSYSSVSLNGINIDPQNGAPILIIPSLDAIASSSVRLYLHGTLITPEPIPLTAYLPANGGHLANLTLADNIPLVGSLLPLTGALNVDLYPAGKTLPDGYRCQYDCAGLYANAVLPDQFTGAGGNFATAQAVITADAVDGINLSSLDASLSHLDFGGVGISQGTLRYRASDGLLYASVTLQLTPVIGNISGTIEFTGGSFREASLQYSAGDSPGIDLGGPFNIYLTQLGGSLRLHPTVISANATITGGPNVLGCSLVSIAGQATVRFAPFGLNLNAAGSLLCQKVSNEYIDYGNGYFNVGGSINVGFGPFSLKSGVDLGIDPPHFQFDGDVEGCLDLYLFSGCLGAEGVISDKGIGVCADLGFTHAGGGVVFPDHVRIFFDTCDIQTFRSLPKFAPGSHLRADGFRAFPQAVQVSRTFTVPDNQKVAVIGVVGQGNAPEVTLVGPGGRTIDTPADDYVKTPQDVVIADGKSTHTTYFFINHAAGTWHVNVNSGSVPITAIHQAGTLADPNVHAELRPVAGAQERFSYSLHPLAGQKVTFEEQAGSGKRGYRVIGQAHGARGTITFSPSLAFAPARTLVAIVTQNGQTREQVVLAHFRAQSPAALPAPAQLHAHRANTTVSVGWRPVTGAGSYLITVTAGKGKGAVHHALATTTTATLGGLPSGSALSVSVTARRSSPWANAPGHAAVVTLAGEKPVTHRVTVVRAS